MTLPRHLGAAAVLTDDLIFTAEGAGLRKVPLGGDDKSEAEAVWRCRPVDTRSSLPCNLLGFWLFTFSHPLQKVSGDIFSKSRAAVSRYTVSTVSENPL